MSLTYLGLDVAPSRAGIAILGQGRRYCTSAGIDGPADLRNLLAVVQVTPDLIAIERSVHQVNTLTNHNAGRAVGWAEAACSRRWPDAQQVLYRVGEWRELHSAPAMRRAEAKAWAIARARVLGFVVEDGDDDAAEAACLAWAASVDRFLVPA